MQRKKYMKVKKFLKISSILTLLTLPVAAVGAISLTGHVNPVKAEGTSVSLATDYNSFALRGFDAAGTLTGTLTPATDSISYNGAWDSSFAVTDQFDTRAGNYSLKAHVYDSSWTVSGDNGTGFSIYYNDINYITFVLKWTSTDTLADAFFLNHVNGLTDNVYASAVLPDGEFVTRGTFTSITGWSKEDGTSVTLSGNSTISISVGFDMTLYVERTTYKDRLVDIIYVQLDAFEADGTTPLTLYSPKYAIDAMSAPLGVTSSMSYRKPQIGFMNYNMTNAVTYSNIVFTNKNTEKVNAKVTRIGAIPNAWGVDTDKNALTYNNNNFASSFLTPNFEISSDGAFDVQATASGTKGNGLDTQLGFGYYYDDANYGIIYLKWNGTLASVFEMVCLFTVDGETSYVTFAACDPWTEVNKHNFDETLSGGTDGVWFNGQFIDAFTDGNWIVDSSEAMGQYSNFIGATLANNTNFTISTGFTYGIQRVRRTYLGTLADSFQMRVSGKDNSGVNHNWYSPIILVDAYTYPNGEETASKFKDVAPQIGFYGCNTDNVTISDIKFNGKDVVLSYSDLEVNRQAATAFVNEYLHMSDYNEQLGYCSDDEHHYYSTAKAAWVNLSADVKKLLAKDDEYKGAYARLVAWAAANGDELNADGTVSSNVMMAERNNNAVIIIVLSVVASLTVIGGTTFFIVRKKKLIK